VTSTLFVELVVFALGVSGTILVGHKHIVGLYLWLISNVIAIPLMLVMQLYGMTALYVVYLATTVYSIVLWRRDQPRKLPNLARGELS